MQTILLVEDNPHQRLLYRFELEDAGYHVLLASSGADAVGVTRNERPHLVVMDPSLPDLEAPMLAKILRAKYSKLPIVVQSGDALQRSEAERYADAFVLKSSDLSSLRDRVHWLIGDKDQRAVLA